MENNELNNDLSSNVDEIKPVEISDGSSFNSSINEEVKIDESVTQDSSVSSMNGSVFETNEDVSEPPVFETEVSESVSSSEPVKEVSVNEVVEPKKEDKKKGNSVITIILVFVIIVGVIVACILLLPGKGGNGSGNNGGTNIVIESGVNLDYQMTSNKLEAFDLYFLKEANKVDSGKNIIYSPLSIKYALEMVELGANGITKQQLDDILGKYVSRKYTNSSNMSFANIFFINENIQNSNMESFGQLLESKLNAEVKFDSFTNADKMNSYISEKTFNLISNPIESVDSNDYFVVSNALAIDMEWVNKIQDPLKRYYLDYANENASIWVDSISAGGFHKLNFNSTKENANSVTIGATANRYDIVNVLGEDNIRSTVDAEHTKWVNSSSYRPCGDVDTFNLDEYINDLNSNYGKHSSSTDFEYYVDDDVKLFAKDLKTYDGVTLQYIGIMPTSDLNTFVNELDKDKANNLIAKLKNLDLESYQDGYVTIIKGYIPLFNFDYKLDLTNQLKQLGVTKMFNIDEAELSGIVGEGQKAAIGNITHKATIDFTNDGITAAASTSVTGYGGGDCGFHYDYDVPTINIDLTFDKPYVFFIRDKETGEVWFTGIVNEPSDFVSTKAGR